MLCPCEPSATTLEPFGADIALRVPFGMCDVLRHPADAVEPWPPTRTCLGAVWYLNVLQAPSALVRLGT